MGSSAPTATVDLDYYAVLGAAPGSSLADLRSAFRQAVLRHHPDRQTNDPVATLRTAALNRAWAELRDAGRRMAYDRTLAAGVASTVAWPLQPGEAAPRRAPRRARPEPEPPSRWHQPAWRSVEGFRVPAEVFLRGPDVYHRWIVEHYIDGEDWRRHSERYWLRFAAAWYRERNRLDDWVGSLERLAELDTSLDTVVAGGLTDAYLLVGQPLRGVVFLGMVADRWPPGSAPHRQVVRLQRILLNAFRDQSVRRGPPADRAENAEMLLNALEANGQMPSWADLRAAIAAHRRAGSLDHARALIERAADEAPSEPGRWYGLVQLLTEDGQLERASDLLAAIARGSHPEALDRSRIRSDPLVRIGAARRRLARARARAGGVSRR
jgi:hypothetical protein